MYKPVAAALPGSRFCSCHRWRFLCQLGDSRRRHPRFRLGMSAPRATPAARAARGHPAVHLVPVPLADQAKEILLAPPKVAPVLVADDPRTHPEIEVEIPVAATTETLPVIAEAWVASELQGRPPYL